MTRCHPSLRRRVASIMLPRRFQELALGCLPASTMTKGKKSHPVVRNPSQSRSPRHPYLIPANLFRYSYFDDDDTDLVVPYVDMEWHNDVVDADEMKFLWNEYVYAAGKRTSAYRLFFFLLAHTLPLLVNNRSYENQQVQLGPCGFSLDGPGGEFHFSRILWNWSRSQLLVASRQCGGRCHGL
jgi:hypothetical protein